jgi:hypothetical protein
VTGKGQVTLKRDLLQHLGINKQQHRQLPRSARGEEPKSCHD